MVGAWLVVWTGCTSGFGTGNYAPKPASPDPSTPTGTTGATGTTGDTAGPTDTGPAFDCSDIPTGPFNVETFNIVTTEDFDFDALGSLVYSDWVNFVAVDSDGNQSVIAPGINDTRGIQILSDGNIAAAYITEGRIGRTLRDTGASETLIGGLSGPNALDIGDNDIMYYTETAWGGGGSPRVSSFDPATGDTELIAQGFGYPNGVALNNEQNILYVADDASGVYRIEKTGGLWGQKERLFDPQGGNEAYDGIEVDICGNVYIVQFYNGELYRFDPETRDAEFLINLNDQNQFLWNAIRWGSGRGIWRRDVLYVTDRNKIFAVEIGVPGRNQPVDNLPL